MIYFIIFIAIETNDNIYAILYASRFTGYLLVFKNEKKGPNTNNE
jgi:hypothetical protein